MESTNRRLIFGLLLVLAGVLFFLQNLGLFQVTGLLWAILFGLGGLAFLGVTASNREHWWGLIPGFILLGLGVLIAVDQLFPALSGRVGGSIFLGGIGVAFLAVYLLKPAFWWAVIPMGVMFTLALVAGLDQIQGLETGGIFFLGLAATFGVLTLIKAEGARLTWAWIPALVLGIMGLLILLSASNLITYVWPVVLILAGGFLLARGLARRA